MTDNAPKQKKKIIFPLYSKIAMGIVLLFTLFGLSNRLLEEYGYAFYYLGMERYGIGRILPIITFVGAGLLLSAIIVFVIKNFCKLIWCIIIIAASAFISFWLVVYGSVYSIFQPDTNPIIRSDDGKHCIVIAEDCYLFSPYGGDIYEKVSFCTMKEIYRYDTKIDFYTPFSDGDYTVTWHEDCFELFYDYDGDGEKDTTIEVEYAK